MDSKSAPAHRGTRAPTNRRGRGRPVGDRDAKIGELLLAAREVVAREGCAGASLRKVGERAGCSTGAITYYFADRDDLLAKLVESLFAEFDAWLPAEGGDASDVREMMERALLRRGARSAQLTRQVWLQLLVQAGADAKLAAAISGFYGRFRRRLETVIETAQRNGTIRRDFAADLLADQLTAVGDGWLLFQQVERGRFTARRIRELIDMAMKMIEPAPRHSRDRASHR